MRTSLTTYRFIVALAASLLVACASTVPQTQRSGEWMDPSLGASSSLLRDGKVLVACEAWDLSMRQNCQAMLGGQLQTRGANAVVSPQSATASSSRELDSLLLADSSTVGARTILVLALTPTVANAGFSGASIGIGGFSWGRSGVAGIGLSAPIGGSGWGSMGLEAQGRLVDVPTGRLLWTTTFATTPSPDAAAQVRDLTNAVLNAAQGAGLL